MLYQSPPTCIYLYIYLYVYISIYLHIYTHSNCATRNFPEREGGTAQSSSCVLVRGRAGQGRAGSGWCALCRKDSALSAVKRIVIMIIANVHCMLLPKIIEHGVNWKEIIALLFFFVLALGWISQTTVSRDAMKARQEQSFALDLVLSSQCDFNIISF